MVAVKIRIPEALWIPLCERLLINRDVETAGLCLGETIESSSGPVVVIREAFSLPDEAYRIRRRDQLSIDPVAFNRLTRRARDLGWSVFTVHTHPGASEPWFSMADDAGDARLMPSIRDQIPGAIHGSLVLVEGGRAIARGFEDAAPHPLDLHIVGRTLDRPDLRGGPSEAWFARQELALGAHGQARLRDLRVAVVGLGGIGSLVSMQLAHLGVREIVLIDGDIVDASNLSRIVGATKEDVGRTTKVGVAARYAESLGLTGRVESHAEYLSSTHAAVLAGCDLIVSGVDRQMPRAMLNRLAYRHAVRLIDLGTVFRVGGTGTIIGDAGRVVVVGPGNPCLGCWGHLDPHALRIESLSQEQREAEENAGYIEGASEAQPSVIAFNASVAGAGVIEVLRFATAFAGADAPPMRLAFSFGEGTVRRNALAGDRRCEICGEGRAIDTTESAA